MVFIGGTSLSKCFGIINRFSEDIDLVAVANSRKSKQKETHKVIQELKRNWIDFVDENNDVYRDFKEAYLYYPANSESDLDSRVKVELITFMEPFPVIETKIKTIIYKFLDEADKKKYNMEPITVKTQAPYRTMIEKILLEKEQLYKDFLHGRVHNESQEKRARDFYDIHKIWNYYHKKLPFTTLELKKMINSRIQNRRGRTIIEYEEFNKYLLSEMFERKKIAKQLNEIDFRKLSIKDLDTDDIFCSLRELDVKFRELLS